MCGAQEVVQGFALVPFWHGCCVAVLMVVGFFVGTVFGIGC